MSTTDSNGGNGARDTSGRFQKGNAGGPGNPHVRRLAAHQAAVRDALRPDDLRAVLKKLHSLALEGDVAAARVLLERVVGKSRPEPEAPSSWTFDPEDIHTEAGRERAIKSLLGAVASGAVSASEAKALVGFIEVAGSVLTDELLANLGFRL